jgi:hypothetical protein
MAKFRLPPTPVLIVKSSSMMIEPPLAASIVAPVLVVSSMSSRNAPGPKAPMLVFAAMVVLLTLAMAAVVVVGGPPSVPPLPQLHGAFLLPSPGCGLNLVEQSLGLFQIERVEAFGKLAEDFGRRPPVHAASSRSAGIRNPQQ